MNVLHLTDTNFKKEVLESEQLVLVDFWATWCGPCRMLAPIIQEIAKDYHKKLKVGKLNVEDNPRVASQYGIMSIPTILFFKNGKVIEQIVGVLSKKELINKIAAHL